MSDTSRLRIDLSAVESNLRLIGEIVGPQCGLCPIVKADAYGLGAAAVSRHLQAAGSAMLAVYTTGQAAKLAQAAVGGPILVLAPVHDLGRVDEAYRLLIRGDLHLTVHDEAHLGDLVRLAERFATQIPLHLEVDTGMSRGGCAPDAAPRIARGVAECRWLRLAGISTHFARAGADARFTGRQLATFEGVLDACAGLVGPECAIHVANTYATLLHRRYHRSMVRVGQAWAGYGLDGLADGAFRGEAARLRPIVSWRSEIVHVKTVKRGTPVGYGSRWTAKRRTVIGLIPVGYADGYPMGVAAADDAPRPPCVGIEIADSGERAFHFVRVVGQVNMDQITVDLTDAAARATIGPGTPVELMGTDPAAPNHVPALARAAGTIPHELLCRLNPRIKRLYHAREPFAAAGAAAGSPS